MDTPPMPPDNQNDNEDKSPIILPPSTGGDVKEESSSSPIIPPAPQVPDFTDNFKEKEESPQTELKEIPVTDEPPFLTHRPDSASQWSDSYTEENPNIDLSIDKESDEFTFSEQSKRMIQAIEEGLSEPSCTQIDGYEPGKISAQFQGQNYLFSNNAFSSAEDYIQWLKKMVKEAGAVVTWEKIKEDRMGVLDLKNGGRLTIFLPPIARQYPTFSLRKHTAQKWQGTHFVESKTLDQKMLNFLQACVASHVNILFVGQMGSGKSTLLRALAQGFGDNEKIAIVEQIPELNLKKPLSNEYIYQPTIEGLGLGNVLDFNLYNGLDRLVVGEVHLEGITKMLETMIITEGSMSTYHAFSTEQAGERMKLALQIENANVSAQTASSFIRNAIEVVVVLEKIGSARRVMQITEIDWRTSSNKETLGGQDIFVWDREKGKHKAHARPDEKGRIMSKTAKYGVEIPQSWFIDEEDLQRFKRSR